MSPTVSGTVTDKSGNTVSWSTSWTTTTPATEMPPLIGSSSRVEDWDTRKAMLEATGGQLEARRIFLQSFTDTGTVSMMQACLSQNLTPVISFAITGYTWAQIAAGNADAAITTAANRVKSVLGSRLFYVTANHEPDKQADPKTQGEGGDGADYGPMMVRVATIFRSICPGAKVGPILNGWWFSAQSRGFSDAQINYWMDASARAQFDFIAADHYAALDETERAITRAQRHVAYLNRVGFAGSMGIGETNGWTPADLNDMFNYAKTNPKFAGGFAMLWNSTVPNAGPEDWKPVHETGLLDDFQNILVNWRN